MEQIVLASEDGGIQMGEGLTQRRAVGAETCGCPA